MAKKKPVGKSEQNITPPSDDRLAEVPAGYVALLEELKAQIGAARVRAALAINRELIVLYWRIGRAIVERQEREGWGKSVIDRLAQDIQSTFPGQSGFSPSNDWRMPSFDLAWNADEILAQPVRELATDQPPELIERIPWGHKIAC